MTLKLHVWRESNITTIAAKEVNGKVKIAWDSQVTGSNAKYGMVKVVTVNGQVTVGGAGRLRFLNLIHRTEIPHIHPASLADPGFDGYGWLLDCAIPQWMRAVKAEKESLADPEEGAPDGSLLVVIGGKIFTVGFDFAVTPVEDFAAIGSGSDFAITAMHLGKNPKQAVEIAAELDVYTGGKIKEMTV